MTKPNKQQSEANDVNQQEHGEGNRRADYEYRQRTQDFIDAGKVDQAAKKAREAIEGDEAEELERARQDSKARSKTDEEV